MPPLGRKLTAMSISASPALSNFKSYCQKFGTPYVYIINICGYANTSPIKGGQKVFRLYGYNQDLYDKITQMEINPEVLIDEINKIEI